MTCIARPNIVTSITPTAPRNVSTALGASSVTTSRIGSRIACFSDAGRSRAISRPRFITASR